MVSSVSEEPNRDDLFQSLYNQHAAAITAFALRRYGASDAGDIVAESFLVAWRRIDDVPPEPKARAWLLGVARKVAANQLRGERRRAELGRKLSARLVDHFDEQPPIEQLDQQGLLGQALARLSHDDRELLLLIAWDGLTPAEVGTVMGLSSGVVRKRLFRARKRLARHRERVEQDRDRGRRRRARRSLSAYQPEGALG